MRRKAWHLCQIFGCIRKTRSGVAERDEAERYCTFHHPARVQSKNIRPPEVPSSTPARRSRLPLVCVYRDFIRRPHGSVFTSNACAAKAPRAGNKPKFPNRHGEPLCRAHRLYADSEEAFPGTPPEAPTPKPFKAPLTANTKNRATIVVRAIYRRTVRLSCGHVLELPEGVAIPARGIRHACHVCPAFERVYTPSTPKKVVEKPTKMRSWSKDVVPVYHAILKHEVTLRTHVLVLKCGHAILASKAQEPLRLDTLTLCRSCRHKAHHASFRPILNTTEETMTLGCGHTVPLVFNDETREEQGVLWAPCYVCQPGANPDDPKQPGIKRPPHIAIMLAHRALIASKRPKRIRQTCEACTFDHTGSRILICHACYAKEHPNVRKHIRNQSPGISSQQAPGIPPTKRS